MSITEVRKRVVRVVRDRQTEMELAYEMMALVQVLDFDYERWCKIMALDPTVKDSFVRFSEIHQSYMETWKEDGDKKFYSEIDWRADIWGELLKQKDE